MTDFKIFITKYSIQLQQYICLNYKHIRTYLPFCPKTCAASKNIPDPLTFLADILTT